MLAPVQLGKKESPPQVHLKSSLKSLSPVLILVDSDSDSDAGDDIPARLDLSDALRSNPAEPSRTDDVGHTAKGKAKEVVSVIDQVSYIICS